MTIRETQITGAAALAAANGHCAFTAANCREPPTYPAGAPSAFPQIS